MHTEGTHKDYRDHPKSFTRFSSSDVYGMSAKQQQIKSYYLNGICYQDTFIYEGIKRVENKAGVVLYIGDHGEEVFDDPQRNRYGHFENSLLIESIKVPFVIWSSPKLLPTRSVTYQVT